MYAGELRAHRADVSLTKIDHQAATVSFPDRVEKAPIENLCARLALLEVVRPDPLLNDPSESAGAKCDTARGALRQDNAGLELIVSVSELTRSRLARKRPSLVAIA